MTVDLIVKNKNELFGGREERHNILYEIVWFGILIDTRLTHFGSTQFPYCRMKLFGSTKESLDQLFTLSITIISYARSQ